MRHTNHAVDTDDAVSTLKNLIATCRDGENGFRDAAEDLENAALRQQFVRYSQQRAVFAAELARDVERLGGDADTSGHVAGAIHRGWINLKAALTGHDDGAIIAEAERGEDVAVRNYEEALETELPADARIVVERQYIEVKRTHDQVRALRDAYKPNDKA